MKKMYLIVLLMVIGFAAINTTLIMTGNTNLGFDTDGFSSKIIFSSVKTNEGETEILESKDVFVFNTNSFSEYGDSAEVDFIVTNYSENYDSDVVVSCTLESDDNSLYGSYLTLEDATYSFDLASGKSKFETLKVIYNGGSSVQDFDISITCIIEPTPLPKEQKETDEPAYSVSIIAEENGQVNPDTLEIRKNEIGTFTATPDEGYYISKVECTNGYEAVAKVGEDQTLEQTITIINSDVESDSECTIEFTAESCEYCIGDEVQVLNEGVYENFYVIKDSYKNEETVTLFSKFIINTSTYTQYGPDATTDTYGIQFTTSPYWSDECNSYPCELNGIENGDATVVNAAKEYGKKLKGTGRLMTYNEANSLSPNLFMMSFVMGKYASIISGTYADEDMEYWLSPAPSGTSVYTIDSMFLVNAAYNVKRGVRPVIEVPKSLVRLVK